MVDASLTWVVCTDLVGVTRGRAVTGYEPSEQRPTAVGWVPADMALDPFGGLVENPWGSSGDLRLTPDPTTFVEIDASGGRLPPFRFVQAGCVDLDGEPWVNCPRHLLDRQLAKLRRQFGLQLLAAFEHEFALLRPDTPLPFSIDAGRRAEPLLTEIVGALTAAGIGPENILPEFGRNQLEVTHEPAVGVAAADRAVITREIVREVARVNGEAITFAPIIGPGGGGNGAHVHLSLLDDDGRPLAPTGPYSEPEPLSCSPPPAGQFTAGIAAHLPALVALTAPSVASYLRLQPGHWSAAYTAYGEGNREAALRLAPGRPPGGRRPALGPSLEYRPCDATANPALVLAALVAAGMDGIERELPVPESITVDPDTLSEAERAAKGIERLPRSLGAAIEALEADEVIRSILPPELFQCWSSLKRSEIERFRAASPSEIIEAYVDAY